MIATWIRQHSVIRSLWRWIPLIIGGGTFLFGITMFLHLGFPGSAPGPFSWDYIIWVFILWKGFSAFLYTPPGRERCSLFTVGLPIPARELWLAHLAASILATWVLLAIGIGLIAALQWLYESVFLHNPVAMTPGFLTMSIQFGAGFLLGVVILQTAAPARQSIPLDRKYFFRTFSCLLGIPTIILILSALPLIFAVVPVVIAAILAYRVYHSLPESLSVAPSAAVPSDRPSAESASQADGPGPLAVGPKWRLYLKLYRILTIHPILAAIPLVFVFLMGAIQSDFSTLWLGGDDIRFTYVVLTGYMLMATIAVPMNQLHMLDGLPVSRHRILALIIIPVFLILSLGYGAGNYFASMGSTQVNLIEYRESDSRFHLSVPYSTWRIAWDGVPPVISSPWGESHRGASTVPLYRGSRIALYSPFSTPEGSSADFVALQMSRAIESIYGKAIPLEEIRDRYLAVGPEGRVALKKAGFNLLEDYPGLRPAWTGPLFPLILMAVGLFFTGYFLVYMRTFRIGTSESFRKGVFLGLLVVAMGLHVSQIVAAIIGWARPEVTAGFWQIILRDLVENHPMAGPGIWVISALALFGAFRTLQARFGRIEAPVVECKKFWLLGA